MKPYIEELIKDIEEFIKQANKSREEKTKANKNSLITQLCQSKEFHYGNPQKIEKIVGIPRAAFPPDRLLTKEEKENLSKAMEMLLNAWGFFPEFPPRLPFHKRYNKLRELWKSEQVYLGTGVNYIDICDFDDSNCPYRDYCNMCDLIKEQEKLYKDLMQNRNHKNQSGE